MKIIRLNENDIEKLVGKIINESRMFGGKPTPDERIAQYLLDKLNKEIPEVQSQFIGYNEFGGIDDFWGSTAGNGYLEGDIYRVNFQNKSGPIRKTDRGILAGGDFGVAKIYKILFRIESGKRGAAWDYRVMLTGEDKSLDIPQSLAKRIYNKVKEHEGNIRVFKVQRKIDKGVDDETDLFDQLSQ